MSEPLVSVLMPVRNGQAFVVEAIASVLAQTLRAIELVIVDDGSTDATPRLLAAAARLDGRVRLIRQDGLGLVVALNRGLAACRAPLVARMDADDLCVPDRLACQLAAMRARPELAVLGGSVLRIDLDGRPGRVLRYPRGAMVDRHFWQGSPVAHPTAMFRRDIVLSLGGYREAYRHCEDYDLWLRCRRSCVIDNLPRILLRYRVHGGNVSSTRALEQTLGTFTALGCSLVARRTGVDPTGLLPADRLEAWLSLSLTARERRELAWAILAHNAHVIGDDRTCPLLAVVRRCAGAVPRSGHEHTMAFHFHRRALRFFLRRRDLGGMLRHLAGAALHAPRAALAMVCTGR